MHYRHLANLIEETQRLHAIMQQTTYNARKSPPAESQPLHLWKTIDICSQVLGSICDTLETEIMAWADSQQAAENLLHHDPTISDGRPLKD